MTPEMLTALASIGTFVVIAATAIAAIVQLHHIRGSNQMVALDEFREAFESPEFTKAREDIRALPERIKDPLVRRDLERTPEPEWLRVLLFPATLLETLGAYVKLGIVRENIVMDLWSFVIVQIWDDLAAGVVVMRRSRGPALYENFEMLACLAKRWLAKHPTSYPMNLPRIAPPDQWLKEDG